MHEGRLDVKVVLRVALLLFTAAGLLPAASGMQIGIVKKIHEDPLKQYRVQVQLAAMESDSGPIWARWVSSQASNAYGCFFLPSVGDEVSKAPLPAA